MVWGEAGGEETTIAETRDRPELEGGRVSRKERNSGELGVGLWQLKTKYETGRGKKSEA